MFWASFNHCPRGEEPHWQLDQDESLRGNPRQDIEMNEKNPPRPCAGTAGVQPAAWVCRSKSSCALPRASFSSWEGSSEGLSAQIALIIQGSWAAPFRGDRVVALRCPPSLRLSIAHGIQNTCKHPQIPFNTKCFSPSAAKEHVAQARVYGLLPLTADSVAWIIWAKQEPGFVSHLCASSYLISGRESARSLEESKGWGDL